MQSGVLEYLNTFDDNTRTTQFLELIPNLIPTVSDEDFPELSDLLLYLSNSEYKNFDATTIFPLIIDTISNKEFSLKRRNLSHQILLSLFENYEIFGKNLETVSLGYQATENLAEDAFDQNDSRGISPYDLYTICSFFDLSITEITEYFASIFSENSQKIFGAFSKFIINTQDNIFFYRNNIEYFTSLLKSFLESSSLCLIESTLAAFSSLFESNEDALDPYVNDIYISSLTAVKNNLSKELLSAFKDLLKSARKTDIIFDDCLNMIIEILPDGNTADQQVMLGIVAELVIGCNGLTEKQFTTVFQIIQEIMSDFDNPLLCDAVYIIGHLSQKGKEYFVDILSDVVTFLSTGLNSDDETILVYFINAFGFVATSFPEQIYESINEIVSLFAQISTQETSDDNITRKPGDYALRWGCNLCSIFPETFIQNYETFLNSIRVRSNIHSAIASEYFARATYNIEDEELIRGLQMSLAEILIPMTKNGDVELVGHCFTSLSLIFENLDIEKQRKIAKQALKCFNFTHKCFTSKTGVYLQDLHPNANEIINLSLNIPELTETLVSFIPSLIPFTKTKDLLLSDAILIVLTNLFVLQPNNEHSSDVFFDAISQLERNSYATFYLFGRFSKLKLPIIDQNNSEIYEEVKKRLSQENNEQDIENMMLIDNCLSCLSYLVRNYEFDVHDYAQIALASMPCKCDIDENSNVMSLFEFIYSQLSEDNKYKNVFHCFG
ncbi:armadillo (ARM) repeat-containing protein family [Trichomonas vaginalis G3]|uniref:armadillo (ARM) repeat-containing protein family n=1 Tax=Trichomonas vaginalis (strain ATCC PRA-98 / G3) TaxID=412133 RepID=UPI0021E53A04|nr:armadillo (ARM) repeat-containing protein family [Trichomonas vaginalis G3]KAI5488646.1 armadillo (ARM) repeat-containing protein family [Trichomonas vaginalis G3]